MDVVADCERGTPEKIVWGIGLKEIISCIHAAGSFVGSFVVSDRTASQMFIWSENIME